MHNTRRHFFKSLIAASGLAVVVRPLPRRPSVEHGFNSIDAQMQRLRRALGEYKDAYQLSLRQAIQLHDAELARRLSLQRALNVLHTAVRRPD